MSSSPRVEASLQRPAGRWRGWLRRRDSLRLRLLLLQALVLVLLGSGVGLLFYAERNITIAGLYVERWAPVIAAALQADPLAPPVGPEEEAVHWLRPGPPEPSHRPWAQAPRFAALREALVQRRLPVQELRLSLASPQPRLWLHLAPPGRAPGWLGLPAQVLVPEWSARTLALLGTGVALLTLLSWATTRWLVRPLEALRRRIDDVAPAADDLPPIGPEAAWAVPEIAAIDGAHRSLRRRLAQQERERALLLAGVSHDLRSPLGRIRLSAELLPDDPAWAKRRAAIVRNVQQADRLIESFLDHVRCGELPLDQTVDLAALARSVVAMAERPDDELRLEAPLSLPLARAHPLLLERLMANLLDNAFAHGAPPVRLSLGGSPEGGCWLAVADGGEGLAPDEAATLQAAFARGDRARSRPGSGLGLAIVQQTVARLGGTLQFQRLAPQQGPYRHEVRVALPRR